MEKETTADTDTSKNKKKTTGGAKLRDRPSPPPELRWSHDHRLPRELNELNTAMWDHSWQQFVHKETNYRIADRNEMSEPKEFVAVLRDVPMKG